MRTPKNRLQDLEQTLHHSQQCSELGQSPQPSPTLPPPRKSVVQAMAFDINEPIKLSTSRQSSFNANTSAVAMAFDANEPIELHYNHATNGYEVGTVPYAKAHSVASELDFGAAAFEVESFDAANDATKSTPAVQPEVVTERSQPLPTKSAAPSLPPQPAAPLESTQGIATADDFLEDLQAILNGEKHYDSEGLRPTSDQPKQGVNPAPQANQFSASAPVPTTPEPTAPVRLEKPASPHDLFDRMAQGIPPETPPTAPEPTYSSAHSVFDRMGKNMAFANSFDLGTISLQQRFDEFDRIFDAEEDKSLAQATTHLPNFKSILNKVFQLDTKMITGEIKEQSMIQPIQWLSYFWQEGGGALNSYQYSLNKDDKEKFQSRMANFLDTFFDYPQLDDALKLINQPLHQKDTAFAQLLEEDEKVGVDVKETFRQALLYLLYSGFVPVGIVETQTDDKTKYKIVAPATDYLARFPQVINTDAPKKGISEVISDCIQTFTQEYLGWRGDSRKYEDIETAGGLYCKAESEIYAKPRHMRTTWHPFADKNVRSYMYYRKQQKDNCLHTVVSVSILKEDNDYEQRFKINACFPQLEELTDTSRSQTTAVEVEKNSTRENVDLFVDSVTLYLCKFPEGDDYFDTQKFQQEFSGDTKGFPEIGVREIPAKNIVAYVKYVRVHHGTTNGEGFTAIPVLDQSALKEDSGLFKFAPHWLSQDKEQEKKHDPSNAYRAFVKACSSFSAAWKSDGFGKAGKVIGSVKKIGNMVVNDELQIEQWSN